MNIKKVIVAVSLGGLAIFLGFFIKNSSFFEDEIFYAGTLEATRVVVPARLPSQIINLYIKSGDRVKKGQILAKLDDADLQIARKKASSRYERCLITYKSGGCTKTDLDASQAEKDDLELKTKEWCVIKSPIGGIVLTKYRECGEWVAPGSGIAAIADIINMKVIFYIEHDKVASLKVGDSIVCILPEMPDHRFCGKITIISSEPEFTPKNVQTRSERTRLVYGIQVDFENNDEILKPGMTIETQFKAF
jgi:HlyD family secretion protein